MRLSRFVPSILLCGTAVGAQVPPLPIIDVPPLGATAIPTQVFMTWTAQDARCSGGPVTFTLAPTVTPALRWAGGISAVKPVEYTFTVDETGRPLDVTRMTKDYVMGETDLGPALVVARLRPGAARRDCSLRFVAAAQSVPDTPTASMMAYIMSPTQRPTAAMYARIRPAGSTCFDPPPQVRNRAFPAFDAIPKQPGRQGWSMIGFDIDATGKPIHPKREAGSGNAALDTESVTAVGNSRFAPGARTGCQYPYWIAAAALPAPPKPEEAQYRPADATCPAKAEWAVPPRLIYPPSFARRWIEGWAIIGYDIAPWGATGNVRVLAAQPAVEFGEQAKWMLSAAKRAPSQTGYVGCVDRVSFRMPRPGEEASTASDTPPPPF